MKPSETGQGLGVMWGACGLESPQVSEPGKFRSRDQGLSLLISRMGE